MENFSKMAKKASSLAVRTAPGILKAGAKVLPLLTPATSVANVIIAPVLEAVTEATGALMEDISQKIMEDSGSGSDEEDTLRAIMKKVEALELSDNDNHNVIKSLAKMFIQEKQQNTRIVSALLENNNHLLAENHKLKMDEKLNKIKHAKKNSMKKIKKICKDCGGSYNAANLARHRKNHKKT